MIERRCPRCEAIKPIEEFGLNRARKNGRASYCQPCMRLFHAETLERRGRKPLSADQLERKRAADRATYYKDKDRWRASAFRRKYGATLQWRREQFERQCGRCAICGRHEDDNRGRILAIDHEHRTGRLRELLCSPCNCALGYLRDDVRLLDQAREYLIRHGALV